MRRASWNRDQDSVVGQLAEWEVWVELVVQSHGRLHVFLPLLDRGIDALIHRIDDSRWFPVQVKGRSQLRNGSLQIVVPAGSLADPDALLLGVALEDDHVGPFVLVITERDFKRFANRSHARGKPTFAAQVSLVPGRKSRWAEYDAGSKEGSGSEGRPARYGSSGLGDGLRSCSPAGRIPAR